MSTPWFFLSYASISPDYDKEVQGFSADLVKAIRADAQLADKGVPPEDIGFCAPTVMDEGANWPKELAEKLASCRVLVSLYSKRYFESAACGKEFKIFSDRVKAYVADTNVQGSDFIVPVLWVVKKGFADSLPRAVQSIHYGNPFVNTLLEFGGVYHLLSEDQINYRKYVKHLANTIIRTAEAKPPLPVLDRIPDFDKAFNAWVDPPAAPVGLDVLLSAPRQISLMWENNSADELGFWVERRREGGRPDFVTIKQLSATSTSYTDAKVAAGTTYYYRVCAFNDGGYSDYSETVEIKTDGQPPPPMPSDLSTLAVTKGQIDLRWKDNTNGTGCFKLERCDVPNNRSFKQVANVASGVNSYSDVGLTPATTYIYRVCASDDSGDSDYSDEARVTTLRARRILIPVLITIVVVALAAGGALTFRCKIIPSFCADPTASRPTPPIRKTFWSDAFTNSASESNPPLWQLGGSWDTPAWQPRWKSGSTNGVLIVQGTGVGVVKAFYFDNFELIFPVQFEAGTKAGWILRAQSDAKSAYTGFCFILERAGDAFQLTGYWGSPQREPDIAPEPQRIPITEYEFDSKDIIEIDVKVDGDTISMVFKLQSSQNTGRPQLRECFTATAHAGSKGWAAGYVGVFAGDKDTRLSIDTLELNPLPQANPIIEKCTKSGPNIDLK